MHNNRRILLIIVMTCVCLIGFCSLLISLEAGLRNKTSYNNMNRLIQGDRSVDVLVVGSSQAAYDFLPMELWNEYGMTSYVLHANNNGVKRYKPMVELALEYCDPKLIVVNTDQYWIESPPEKQLASYHEFADAFPLSWTKIKTTCELYSDSETRKEILFPFLTYHDRWKEADDSDFMVKDDAANGSDYSDQISSITLPEPEDEIEATLPEEGADNIGTITDFIDIFQARGIPVLVVTFPFEASSSTKKLGYYHALAGEIEAHGASYLNLLENQQVVDARTDFKDGTHLNAKGARKMTSYLGDVFRSSYGIPDRRSDDMIRNIWDADYKAYQEMKVRAFLRAESVQSALLLAADNDFKAAVYLRYDSPALFDSTCDVVITEIAPFIRLQEAKDTECSFLGLYDPVTNEISEDLDPDQDTWIDALGGSDAVYTDDADAYIAIFDRMTGKHLGTKIFTTKQILTSIEEQRRD